MFYDSLKNYFLHVKIFFEILKFVLRIFNFQLLYRTLKIIFYVLNNNFSYTQLSFVFLLQKNFIFNHDDTDALLSLSERFFYLYRAFFLFLLQKDFAAFRVFLFEAFLSFFKSIYIYNIYIYAKDKKNLY